MKYYKNEQWNDLKVKVSDTLPKGTEVDYEGTTVPDGWEKVDDKIVELYVNTSGATSGFTLNDTITNYKYIEVIGCRGEGQQISAKGVVNGITRICLTCCYYGYGTSMWVDQLGLAFSGKTCTFEQYSSLSGSGSSQTVANSRNIKVIRVLGYK